LAACDMGLSVGNPFIIRTAVRKKQAGRPPPAARPRVAAELNPHAGRAQGRPPNPSLFLPRLTRPARLTRGARRQPAQPGMADRAAPHGRSRPLHSRKIAANFFGMPRKSAAFS